MKQNLKIAASAFALVAGLGFATRLMGQGAPAKSKDIMVPKFEADPYWPKPLPNGWVLGETIGVAVDPKDDVWIIHRPGSLDAKESYGTRNEGECCTAAPDVLEFNPAGALIRHWGRDEERGKGHDWPSSNHGILIDQDGNVWIGANTARQPGPDPGTTEQYVQNGSGYKTQVPRPDPDAPAGPGVWHDSFVLKFTVDGKFLGEIGKANASKGSLDTNNVRGVAQLRIIPSTGELLLADGYGNHRVSVWDPKTLQFKRMWGAYGKPPTDLNLPFFNADSPQFGNPVHCAQPSNDGLIYVCDRENDRIQVFKVDGTYVKQIVLEPITRGDGSPWEIAFLQGSPAEIHVRYRRSQ